MNEPFLSIFNYVTKYEWSGIITLMLSLIVVSLYMTSKILKHTKLVRDAYVELRSGSEVHSYKKQFSIETAVSKSLNYIRHEVNADRVVLCRIHNGVNDIAQNPLLKISCFNESLHSHMPPRSKYIQGIPISFCTCFLDELVQGKNIRIPDLQSKNEDPCFSEHTIDFMRKSGAKSVYIFPLEDSFGNLFGSISVHFVRNKKQLDDADIKWLHNRVSGIGTLISLTKEKTNEWHH